MVWTQIPYFVYDERTEFSKNVTVPCWLPTKAWIWCPYQFWQVHRNEHLTESWKLFFFFFNFTAKLSKNYFSFMQFILETVYLKVETSVSDFLPSTWPSILCVWNRLELVKMLPKVHMWYKVHFTGPHLFQISHLLFVAKMLQMLRSKSFSHRNRLCCKEEGGWPSCLPLVTPLGI